jgi:phospholipase C
MPSALDLVETIVVVIMENRSFDHMLGYLSLPGTSRIPVEGVQSDPAWLRQHANSGVEPFEFSVPEIDDPPQERATIAMQLGTPSNPGGPCPMNGFVESYLKRQPAPSDKRLVMGYYGAQSVPTFDFFAHNFTVCDHWFAALPTGTQANRLMAMGGATTIIDNAPLFLPDQPLVYDWLAEHQVTWCAYQSGHYLPFFALMRKWQDEIANSLALDVLVSHAPSKIPSVQQFRHRLAD